MSGEAKPAPVNWLAIVCWLSFSSVWWLLLSLFFGRWVLSAFVGMLLGFLTLCAVDIVIAWRNSNALAAERDRKSETGSRKDQEGAERS